MKTAYVSSFEVIVDHDDATRQRHRKTLKKTKGRRKNKTKQQQHSNNNKKQASIFERLSNASEM